LRAIDDTLAHGCRFRDLLTTTDFTQCQARMSEVRVAERFLVRGFDIAALPASGETAADLRVLGDGVEATLEVYRPRVWLALADWQQNRVDELKNVDKPLSYLARAGTSVRGMLTPWAISGALAETATTA
jgi:hypothetical protein